MSNSVQEKNFPAPSIDELFKLRIAALIDNAGYWFDKDQPELAEFILIEARSMAESFDAGEEVLWLQSLID